MIKQGIIAKVILKLAEKTEQPIKDIENPSEALQIESVKQNGHTIKDIKNPSEEVQLEAVKQNGGAIYFIKNPSEKVQIEAIKQNVSVIDHIIEKGITLSEKVQLVAVKEWGYAIEDIIKGGIKPSKTVQLEAIKDKGGAIKSLIDADIIPTEEIQLEAVKNWSYAIIYILEANIKTTNKIIETALEEDPELLEEIKKYKKDYTHPKLKDKSMKGSLREIYRLEYFYSKLKNEHDIKSYVSGLEEEVKEIAKRIVPKFLKTFKEWIGTHFEDDVKPERVKVYNRISETYKKLQNINYNSPNNILMTINIALNEVHNNGSMLQHLSSNTGQDISVKFLNELSNLDTKKWDKEIKQILQGAWEKRHSITAKVKASLPDKDIFIKWQNLVNMGVGELQSFINSDEGKEAGLSESEAKKLGIHSGRESAKWILKMKPLGKTYEMAEKNWTPKMWYWARRQNSFISRMLGNKGSLFEDKDKKVKSRKHLSLLIWGHNPRRIE